jgi:hypothetical protein
VPGHLGEKALFTSPSITYSSHPIYAQYVTVPNLPRQIQVVLQMRQFPGQSIVGCCRSKAERFNFFWCGWRGVQCSRPSRTRLIIILKIPWSIPNAWSGLLIDATHMSCMACSCASLLRAIPRRPQRHPMLSTQHLQPPPLRLLRRHLLALASTTWMSRVQPWSLTFHLSQPRARRAFQTLLCSCVPACAPTGASSCSVM